MKRKMVRPVCFTPDRIFLVHLLCVFVLTYSSFMFLLYLFLNFLEDLINIPRDQNRDKNKWWVFALTIADFALGSVLSYGINQKKNVHRRGKILLWIYLDTVLVPVYLHYLQRFNENIIEMKHEEMKKIYLRVNYAHTCYVINHLNLLFLVINFMAYHEDKVKKYDPSIRPAVVYEPTYPSITSTESRHIRFSSSIMTMHSGPTTSKKL